MAKVPEFRDCCEKFEINNNNDKFNIDNLLKNNKPNERYIDKNFLDLPQNGKSDGKNLISASYKYYHDKYDDVPYTSLFIRYNKNNNQILIGKLKYDNVSVNEDDYTYEYVYISYVSIDSKNVLNDMFNKSNVHILYTDQYFYSSNNYENDNFSSKDYCIIYASLIPKLFLKTHHIKGHPENDELMDDLDINDYNKQIISDVRFLYLNLLGKITYELLYKKSLEPNDKGECNSFYYSNFVTYFSDEYSEIAKSSIIIKCDKKIKLLCNYINNINNINNNDITNIKDKIKKLDNYNNLYDLERVRGGINGLNIYVNNLMDNIICNKKPYVFEYSDNDINEEKYPNLIQLFKFNNKAIFSIDDIIFIIDMYNNFKNFNANNIKTISYYYKCLSNIIFNIKIIKKIKLIKKYINYYNKKIEQYNNTIKKEIYFKLNKLTYFSDNCLVELLSEYNKIN